nr:uncharacterized protein LOC111517298 [Leptinotarsa decemlineata]
MRKAILLVIMEVVFMGESFAGHKKDDDLQGTQSDKVFYQYIDPVLKYSHISTDQQDDRVYKTYSPPHLPLMPQTSTVDLQHLVDKNPLAASLLLSSMLHLPSMYALANHPELLPINPYIALLLSQYGRYLPQHGASKGLYGYQAANNYHNNKPFGSYKIYDDSE